MCIYIYTYLGVCIYIHIQVCVYIYIHIYILDFVLKLKLLGYSIGTLYLCTKVPRVCMVDVYRMNVLSLMSHSTEGKV